MIIRNDDYPHGTSLDEMKQFCELCDRYDVKLLHAVTIFGECYDIDSSWDNKRIVDYANKKIEWDKFDYMLTRNDMYAVHGTFHTHKPTELEMKACKMILESIGLPVTHLIYPFNEKTVEDDTFCGLKVIGKIDRIEDYLPKMPKHGQYPTDEMVYLHSWRFFRGWYKLDDLENLFKEIHDRPTVS